jgi:hypothetical protein
MKKFLLITMTLVASLVGVSAALAAEPRRLNGATDKLLPIFTSSDAMMNWYKLQDAGVKSNDSIRMRLLSCGVPDHTGYIVTNGGFFSSTIMIIEGDDKGCTGVVPNDWIRQPQLTVHTTTIHRQTKTYAEARADPYKTFKVKYAEEYLLKHPEGSDLVNKLDFSTEMFTPQDYAKVLVGTVRVTDRRFWACPAWNPDAPKGDFINRTMTQINEGQCIDFKTGDHVLIHEYRSGNICVTEVGSAKQCQWNVNSFSILPDMGD